MRSVPRGLAPARWPLLLLALLTALAPPGAVCECYKLYKGGFQLARHIPRAAARAAAAATLPAPCRCRLSPPLPSQFVLVTPASRPCCEGRSLSQ